MNKNLSNQSGMTLLELIVATAIVSVISMLSVSAYSGYSETAKVSQAVSQIRALSLLINDYAFDYDEYPSSLSDIGNAGLKDPWGNPYVYINLKIDSRDDDDDNSGHGNSHDDDDDDDDDDRRSERHDSDDDDDDDDDHRSERHDSDDDDDDRINIGAARKDGNLVPINTNYDLCSFGKDGKSKPPLRAKDSHDDIIFANDGGYIGLASEF